MDKAERHRQLATDSLERISRQLAYDDAQPSPEDSLERWAQQMPEPEPPRRERGLDTGLVDVSVLIEQRLAAERELMAGIVGQWVHSDLRPELRKELLAELRRERAKAKQELHEEVRALRLELAELQTTIQELRAVLAASDRSPSSRPTASRCGHCGSSRGSGRLAGPRLMTTSTRKPLSCCAGCSPRLWAGITRTPGGA